MTRLRYLWTEKRLLLVSFLAALAVSGFFALRVISSTIYWMDKDHHNQPIEGWMTPRYVSMSYDIPPGPLAEALFLPNPDERDGNPADHMPRRNLEQIAADNGVTLAELQARINDAVAAWRLIDPKPGRD